MAIPPHELMARNNSPRGKSTTLAIRKDASCFTTPVRPRKLSNKAVEFMETRPEKALGIEAAKVIGSELSQIPQYAPEVDKFVAPNEYPAQDYFKESQQQMEKFQSTLDSFSKTLVKRGLVRDLSIELKEPHQYTTHRVQQRHADSDNKALGSLGVIRKTFRQAAKNKGILSNMLSFIPTDSYSALISGGFTIIIGAIEKADSIRDQAYGALEKIPKQLNSIREMLGVHYESIKLRLCADAVFVAIFGVLDALVNELSKNIFKKSLSLLKNGAQYGGKLGGAVGSLEGSVTAFKEEAALCDSKRLGMVGEDVASTRVTVEDTAAKLDSYSKQSGSAIEYIIRKLEHLENRGRKSESQHQQRVEQYIEASSQRLSLEVCNDVYRFLTSNPSFDGRNGRPMRRILDQEELMSTPSRSASRTSSPLRISTTRGQMRTPQPLTRSSTWQDIDSPSRSLKRSSTWGVESVGSGLASPTVFSPPSTGPSSRPRSMMFDRSLVSRWIRKANVATSEEEDFNDIQDCLQDVSMLELEDKDRMRSIIESAEVRSWLTAPTSRVLVIDAETPPDELANPVSCASAFLADTLSRNNAGCCFVLSYMCGYRARLNPASSSPAMLAKTLATQLLLHITENELDVDLSLLMDKEYRRHSRKTLSGSLNLLGRLLQRLPSGETVFIIIDSVSHLPGTMIEAAEDMKNLIETIDGSGAIVKVVMTLPGPPLLNEVERRQWPVLYVPDSIEGWKQDVNLEVLDEGVSLSIGEFRSFRHQALVEEQQDYFHGVMGYEESETSDNN